MSRKKLFCALLSVTLCVGMFALPAGAYPVEAAYTVNSSGVVTAYSGPGGNITVPATVLGVTVTGIGEGVFEGKTAITGVDLSATAVTSIGDEAFGNCSGLVSVTLPNTLASIGDFAFTGTALTTVALPKSLATFGSDVFYKCKSLQSVTVADGNANFASDGAALFNAAKTQLIRYPAGNTQTGYTLPSTVTAIAPRAFESSARLTSVTLPSGLKTIGDSAFEDCSGLTGVSLPNGVTAIGNTAFENCTSLAAARIPVSVTAIGTNAFLNCKSGLVISCSAGSAARSYATANGIACADLPVSSIAVATKPTKTIYVVGQGLSRSGCTLTVTYSDDSTQTIAAASAGVNFYGYNSSNVGTQTIRVNYSGQNAYFTVSVVARAVSWIKMETLPAKTTYAKDQKLDLTGVSIRAIYNNGQQEVIPVTSSMVSGFTSTQSGTKKVTVTYEGCTAAFTVTVDADAPTFGTIAYSAKSYTTHSVKVVVPVFGGTVSSVTHTFSVNGSYTFTVYDAIGNKARKTVKMTRIDRTKPVIKANVKNGKSTKSKVKVKVSDAHLKSKTVTLKGKKTSWKSSFANKGSYVITAVDKAGNKSTYKFRIV